MRLHFGVPDTTRGPTALTIGNFDGVHRGHQAMLARLCAAGRRLGLPTAVMSFEPHPREFFRPADAPARITSLREKIELLSGSGVDTVYICHFNAAFARQTPQEFVDELLVRRLQVRWLLVGDDFRFGARRAGDAALLREQGRARGFAVEEQGTVEDGSERISSSRIRDLLAAGEMERAAHLLGRPWHISGRVGHGDKVGRTWGFPTANLWLRHRQVPVSGIFAVHFTGADGVARPGVASLGIRPSVASGGVRLLEVFLFDYSGDLYGQRARVALLHKFRDERGFSDLDALKAQIAEDADQARAWFDSLNPAAGLPA